MEQRTAGRGLELPKEEKVQVTGKGIVSYASEVRELLLRPGVDTVKEARGLIDAGERNRKWFGRGDQAGDRATGINNAYERLARSKGLDVPHAAAPVRLAHYEEIADARTFNSPEYGGKARIVAVDVTGQARSREDIALARVPGRPIATANEEAIARADREIKNAVAYAAKPHTQAEHLGALMGEMDWRSEKARLQGEPVMKLEPGPKADVGGFGY